MKHSATKPTTANGPTEDTHATTEDTHATRTSIIPLPACLEGPKCTKFWKVFKYVYVIGIIVFGFSLVLLKLIDSVDEWLDSQQRIVLEFLTEDHWIYIILVLLCITLFKAIGVKDVLGLRTISVVILAYRMCDTSPFGTLFITMFIIGLLSSFSKLVEYQVIGHELQVVQGTPVEWAFKHLRKGLQYCCVKDASQLEWVDAKYLFEISERSRDDPSMDILSNLEGVGHAVQLYCKCCACVPSEDAPLTMHQTAARNPVRHTTDENDSESSCDGNSSNWRHNVCRLLYFIVAVIWTSVIEWVQPITELFLFAHNWDLSIMNVLIIVLSEFADFDKAVEAMYIINAAYSDGDIIGAKVSAVLTKPAFWALGYFVIMPPSLLWAYFYHKKHISPDVSSSAEDENDIEMQPKKIKNGSQKV